VTVFGYTMMCEQSPPDQLIADLIQAEQAGFEFSVISDHYQPWLAAQGHSPYAWSVLGAAAQATTQIGRGAPRARAVPLVRPGLEGQRDLPNPDSFESATQFVTEQQVSEQLACGPDVDEHVQKIKPYLDAGFDQVALVQIGGDQQQQFIAWAQRELLPALREL
jgi:hypothetical protein